MNTINTVVIPAAGLGTRVKSLTKGGSKEMLHYKGIPLIDHALIESVHAGFENIIVVSSHKKKDLNKHLATYSKIKVIYQMSPIGLGHSICVASDLIENPYFAVLLPDVVLSESIFPSITRLNAQYDVSTLAVAPIPVDMVSYSGIIDPVRLKPTYGKVKGFVEKPDVDKAPSNLAIIGRYILDKGIFNRLDDKKLSKLAHNDYSELQLTDSLNKNSMYYMYPGRIFDGGDVNSYV